MVLIVASALDHLAPKLVDRFPGGEAALLTPSDLSVTGIRINTHALSDGSIVASGRSVRLDSITGLLTLIPFVFADELVHITNDDRAYVAREMTAFLSFVLAGVSCAKLNPPTATCLSGPAWHREHWTTLAFRLQLPAIPVRRSSPPAGSIDNASDARDVCVTVIGRQIVGTNDEQLQTVARRLAHTMNLDLLRVWFGQHTDGEYRFHSATQFPDLTDERVASAIARHFQDGR